MYEKFTDVARRAMQLANEEAQRLNHESIHAGHILVGICAYQHPTTPKVLPPDAVKKAITQVDEARDLKGQTLKIYQLVFQVLHKPTDDQVQRICNILSEKSMEDTIPKTQVLMDDDKAVKEAIAEAYAKSFAKYETALKEMEKKEETPVKTETWRDRPPLF